MQDIFKAITGELDFALKASQDGMRPDIRQDIHLGDMLAAIEVNLRRANDAWYTEVTPYPEAVGYLRKVAALCVRAGVEFGMPEREVTTREPG